ncbi:3,4-dehydroadipyl-CoA semialdehyde dehydrogenase [Cupriavidus pauculus]|uniref:3,4-dehydroadipyl-CoA semialdehyde dehydrogenase n=1 Tax=Cupriavidus pauculus TaxID=82633 RepID=UPI001FD2ACCB|nr:3,4-dehydroadipyl-CoA semialdehyde dehydrogenase [Cupriavidus pauculus]
MTKILPNYLGGQWQVGKGSGTPLLDPVLGHELVRVSSEGLDLASGFSFARDVGGEALRKLTYRARAVMLAEIVKVLQANRDKYFEIALANSGTVSRDSSVDIDGGIFTVGTYAKYGHELGDRHYLFDGDMVKLGKGGEFNSQHLLVPTRGVALFINAFNFPSWGLWEKAAPALLSGVPVIVKPATATAWLTQCMVQDVIEANILPEGALNVVCGSSAGLLDQLEPFDVVSFTGSADTATLIRSHSAISQHSVRVNIEADSVNSAVLLPDDTNDGKAFDLLVQEVVREMTVKSGQKCTAIRRVMVPESLYDRAGEAISAKLEKVVVGNPRADSVRMGSLVSKAQLESVKDGLQQMSEKTRKFYDGSRHALVDIDPNVACCVAPTLLGTDDPDAADIVHNTEVFGPVATLMPYRDVGHALSLVRRGEGSLVASVFGSVQSDLAFAASQLAESHGRVHVVSPEIAEHHTGHGNVMPQSVHGGPGRAGGGEELGGLRALNFYHRRCAIQAGTAVITHLQTP